MLEFDPSRGGRPMFLLRIPDFLIKYYLDHEGDPKIEEIWTNLCPKSIDTGSPVKETVFEVSYRKYELPEKLRRWIELRKVDLLQMQQRLQSAQQS